MSRRLPQTFADYVVIGISPALVALLVGSLVFFVAEVLYHGEFYLRLLWVLACFVVAMVGIARISMEEGTAYASLFAIPLALAVGTAMAAFVQIGGPLAPLSLPINWGLMALVWWCTHKLTWDCTLIDDQQDASGQGLLQSLGWERDAAEPAAAAAPEATTAAEVPPQPWWQKWVEPDKRPHAPGVWVIYFSLAALPLFGLGQWFIPVEDLASRRYVFWLLVVYAASGLGLLLTTSFLGMRRYLRQRRLEMPGEMAAVWIGVGAVMIVALLIVVALLPRPSPEYSIAHLAPLVTAPEREASEMGFGEEGANDDQQQGNATATQGQDDNPQTSGDAGEQSSGEGGGQRPGDRGSPGEKGKPGPSGEEQAGDKGSESGGKQGGKKSEKNDKSGRPSGKNQEGRGDKKEGDKSGSPPESSSSRTSASQEQSTPPPPPPPPPSFSPSKLLSGLAGWLGMLLKWLFFAAVLLVVLYVAWQNRTELLAAWRKFLDELRSLWARLFGGSRGQVAAAEAAPVGPPPPPPFSSFADPFASGLAARVSLAELVRYSFQALEAWGRERNAARAAGQTPHEFVQQLGQTAPAVASEARQLAEIYGQIAYSGGSAPATSIEHLRQLWRKLQSR